MLRRLTFPLLFSLTAAHAAPPLQPLIDATPAGGVLHPAPGLYAGPAIIAKPITLDGGGKVTIEGSGRGTVLTLAASGATLRGLRLTGSGDSHDGIDAGLLIEGDDNRVEANAIDDVLFGIHVKQGNRNRIAGNTVTGRPAPRGARGDGLRLWNSRHNRIEGNAFARVRDLTFANSPTTTFSATR